MRIERRGAAEPFTPRFTAFLENALGGQALDDIQAPTERRVDYRCARGLVAVEIKSLEEDGSQRMANLTGALRGEPEWPEFYGEWPIESVLRNFDDPESVRALTEQRIGRAVVNHLKKANKQLTAYAGAFPRRNVVRIIVLINEDNAIYSPTVTTTVIQKELRRREGPDPKYAAVDAVLYLTERHAGTEGGDIVYPIISVLGLSVEESPWKQGVLDFIVQKWAAWTGVRLVTGNAEAAASLVTVEAIPDQMPRSDFWRLQYKRNPYLRPLSKERLRDVWDECILIAEIAFLKDVPFRPAPKDIAQNFERFTHVLEEVAHRGIPTTELAFEPARCLEAGRRLRLPPVLLEWLARRG